MQTCKHFFAIFIALNLFLGIGVFAQNKSTLPSLPSVPKGPPKSGSATTPNASTTPIAPVAPINPVAPVESGTPMNSINMPQLPSIAAPVTGSNFYTPGKQYQQNQNQQETQEENQQEKPNASTEIGKALTEITAGGLTNLSAWDLNQLAQRGALGSLSSLNALANNSAIGANNLNAANQQKLLTQVLKELEQIKAEQKNLAATPATGTKPSAMPPRILRFEINSKSILENCSQVYFSEQENDGTFLLTGDVKTSVGRETISETFFILFTASGTKDSRPEYTVAPQLMQSKFYPSPLRAFCEVQSFKATRTGNLVMLNCIVDNNSYNLLLDIGNTQPKK